MMALALLFGATCVAALVFSVWPFGLHPVPIAGLAFTGLIGFSYWAKRRPVLPRPRLSDALSFAAATTVALIVALPLYAEGQLIRVSIFMAGEDGARHFTLFDAIRQVGGYLFLHWDESLNHVYQGMITYPQGSHLSFALLDGFVRSSASDYGTGLSALDHYLAFTVLAYAVFALTLIWAVQWLAEPMLTLGRRVALVAAAFAFVLSSDTFRLMFKQYVGQTAGLTLAVMLIAVLARPPARTRQAMWLITSLVVGLGFTYYLYLPAALFAVLIWLVVRRAQVRRHPVLLGITLLAAVGASVPAAIGLVVGRQDLALLAINPPASRDGLILLAALAAVGLFSVAALASPIWKMYRWSLLAAVAAWLGLLAVQLAMSGGDDGQRLLLRKQGPRPREYHAGVESGRHLRSLASASESGRDCGPISDSHRHGSRGWCRHRPRGRVGADLRRLAATARWLSHAARLGHRIRGVQPVRGRHSAFRGGPSGIEAGHGNDRHAR